MTRELFQARCPLCWSLARSETVGETCSYCGRSQVLLCETPLIRHVRDLREMSIELVETMRLLDGLMDTCVPDPKQEEKGLEARGKAQAYFDRVLKEGREWHKKMRERCMGCQLPLGECMCMIVPPGEQWSPKT